MTLLFWLKVSHVIAVPFNTDTISDINLQHEKTSLVTDQWNLTPLISSSLGVWGEEAQEVLSKCAEKLEPNKQGLYTQLWRQKLLTTQYKVQFHDLMDKITKTHSDEDKIGCQEVDIDNTLLNLIEKPGYSYSAIMETKNEKTISLALPPLTKAWKRKRRLTEFLQA